MDKIQLSLMESRHVMRELTNFKNIANGKNCKSLTQIEVGTNSLVTAKINVHNGRAHMGKDRWQKFKFAVCHLACNRQTQSLLYLPITSSRLFTVSECWCLTSGPWLQPRITNCNFKLKYQT